MAVQEGVQVEKAGVKGRKTVLFAFLLIVLASTSTIARGKFYYGTGEGPGVKVSFPVGRQEFRVHHVTDGDTLELENGERVRYIGIDAPEERRRLGDQWVFDPEPYAVEAARENQELVEGKKVRLEFDRQKRDEFGRLLAYIYVRIGLLGDASYDGEVILESHEIFVNAYLVQKGLARPLSIPPNTRYAGRFERLALKAKRQGLGLWGK